MKYVHLAIIAWLAGLHFVSAAILPGLASQLPRQGIIPRDPIWDAILDLKLLGHPKNDFDCRSAEHPTPVIHIHALLANPAVDLNLLQQEMQRQNYCTFTVLYGNTQHLAPWIGGLGDMRASSQTIADFVLEVAAKTGAAKVDLVGHSEGGVMALYVPMRHPEAAQHINHVYYGLTNLWYAGGEVTREVARGVLELLGCPACDDMAMGGHVYDDFRVTVIVSRNDTLVAPEVSRVDEQGVRNVVVQDTCPKIPWGMRICLRCVRLGVGVQCAH
ncbi:secreted lipase [Apiospora phragmitis]|uniref:Secreted lipase n=1 Tax=Apiospora phragmitis TaxID=2905665 RepID=A0ABR1T9J3_9PEZI